MTKFILKLWGGISLAMGASWLVMTFYAAANPSVHFNPGSTGTPEWIGMGVICLGLAHVITQLEQLNHNNKEKDIQRKD